MVRRRLALIAACVCAALLVVPAKNARSDVSPTGAGASIRAGYATIRAAWLKSDPAPLAQLLSTSFRARLPDGTVENADAFLKGFAQRDRSFKITSMRYVVGAVAIRAGSATVETSQIVLGSYVIGGVAKALREVTVATDTWALVGSVWKIQRSIGRSLIVSLDGHVVDEQHEQVAPPAAALAAIRSVAIRIPTLRLNADVEQLAPIGAAIGNARVVGMGEGSHGTSEFFAFKDRLFKYLVEKKGFTVFGIEANWGDGLLVDRYIKTGKGSAEGAVGALDMTVWNTPEVVDLVRWMRDFNARPGKHPILSFVGFDMQNIIAAAGSLSAYERAHDSTYASKAGMALACAAGIRSGSLGTATQTCDAQITALGNRLRAKGSAEARHSVDVILQYLDYTARGITDGGTRDRDMAANAEWMAQAYPHAKIALWAHNGHIAPTKELSYRSMGRYLRARWGGSYYVVGQTFGSGTVRAVPPGGAVTQVIAVPARPKDEIPAIFAPVHGVAFLDLRSLRPGSPLATWFARPHGIAQIGGSLDPAQPLSQMLSMVVSDSFDGLVYVPTSTASVAAMSLGGPRLPVRVAENAWTLSGLGSKDVRLSSDGDAARLENRDSLDASYNGLSKTFAARPFIGKRIRVSAEVRAVGLIGLEAFAVDVLGSAAASGDSKQWFLDPGIRTNWTPVDFVLTVPRDATAIDVGVRMTGVGAVEVRNVALAEMRAAVVSDTSLPGATGTTALSGTFKVLASRSGAYTSDNSPTEGRDGGPRIGIIGEGASGAIGSESAVFSAAPYLGKTVRVFGLLRTENADAGGFWLRINGPTGASVAFDNMMDRALKGTQPWAPFTVVLRVPKDASGMVGGLMLAGNGKLYGSDLHIEIVPDTTPVTGGI